MRKRVDLLQGEEKKIIALLGLYYIFCYNIRAKRKDPVESTGLSA